MLIGSCLMWLAIDISWLMGSRFLVGLGHSFCLGQIRRYISSICEGNLKFIMIKQMNLHHYFGIVAMVSFGSFLDFENTAMVLTIISSTIFITLMFIPQATEVKRKTMKVRKSWYICYDLIDTPFFQILRDGDLRKKFLIFLTLVICQQYSGIPATLVYGQIIFGKFHCIDPQLFSIAYVVIYFLVNVVGIFVSPNYKKRSVLLISAFCVSLVLAIELVISLSNINNLYWTYMSCTIIFLYMIVHTLGLGNIPFTLISDFFSNKYRNSMIIFFIMLHSLLALTITKIFQMIITSGYHISIPFCLFFCFSSTAFVISYFVLEDEKENICQLSLTKK